MISRIIIITSVVERVRNSSAGLSSNDGKTKFDPVRAKNY